ncbi:hypothetical protein F5Y16DRAFT_399839 [Xylariaceae sp. FL0255]|nr:hypothetical protein F5Y16DRAFT_399839 [Xylariaceae sp. FL0255]
MDSLTVPMGGLASSALTKPEQIELFFYPPHLENRLNPVPHPSRWRSTDRPTVPTGRGTGASEKHPALPRNAPKDRAIDWPGAEYRHVGLGMVDCPYCMRPHFLTYLVWCPVLGIVYGNEYRKFVRSYECYRRRVQGTSQSDDETKFRSLENVWCIWCFMTHPVQVLHGEQGFYCNNQYTIEDRWVRLGDYWRDLPRYRQNGDAWFRQQVATEKDYQAVWAEYAQLRRAELHELGLGASREEFALPYQPPGISASGYGAPSLPPACLTSASLAPSLTIYSMSHDGHASSSGQPSISSHGVAGGQPSTSRHRHHRSHR